MAIDMVDLGCKNGDFQYLCKRLPEGKMVIQYMNLWEKSSMIMRWL